MTTLVHVQEYFNSGSYATVGAFARVKGAKYFAMARYWDALGKFRSLANFMCCSARQAADGSVVLRCAFAACSIQLRLKACTTAWAAVRVLRQHTIVDVEMSAMQSTNLARQGCGSTSDFARCHACHAPHAAYVSLTVLLLP
jgi:hypothetical protein